MKSHRLSLFLLLSVFSFHFLSAQVVINEYSASNISNYVTPGSIGSFDDWVEIYNAGAAVANIGGYYLSDKSSNPTQWQIPAGLTIPAGGRFMFFCTGNNGLFGGSYHTNFKLTQTKGDQIILADAAGLIIDSTQKTLTQRNHSRGRSTDGAATWGVFTTPTPNAVNAGSFVEYAPMVIFNTTPGVYAAAQNISLSCSDPTATIRYTTDGTVPTAASTAYTVPINVAVTTAIRAAAFPASATYLRSFVETNTYFINVTHAMQIVSVCGDYTTLFSGGTGGEIISSFELFDETPSHAFVHEGDGDMNPHGNDSWAFPQKGIRFFPRDEYGYDNNIENKIFHHSLRDEFSCIILKAGASDNYPFATTQNGLQSCHLRDVFIQTMALEHGLHLDGRKYEPCVLYVNGQYWGLYELRERVDADFASYYYNQGKKDVDMIRFWGGVIQDEGTYGGWDSLYNYIMANNMTVQANYDSVIHQFDPMSLIDNFCLNTYANDCDWLNWNTAWWRGRKNTANTPKVRWKYWLWDEDNTFDLGENYTGLPATDFTNDPCQVMNLPQFTGAGVGSDQGHVKILNKLMTNSDFKSLYINRSAELFNTVLRCDTFDAHFARLLARITPEMPNQIARWGGNMPQWQSNLNYMQSQWTGKCAVIDSQYIGCFQVTGPFPITVDVQPPGAGTVTINTYTPGSYPYTGDFYGGVTLGFRAKSATSCAIFDYWEVLQDTVSPNVNSDTVNIFTDSPATLIAHFKVSVDITNNDTLICGNLASPLLLTATGIGPFNWTVSGGGNSIGNAPTLSVNPFNTASYICTALGCSDTLNIGISKTPTFSLGQDKIICDQASYNIAPYFTNPALPAYTYTWQDNSNTTSFNAVSSGQYSLSVDNQGCIVKDTVNIVMSTTPSINLGADQIFCDGTPSVLLDATSMATATYSWQDGSNLATLTANQDGLFWVIVNNLGCIDKDSINFVFSNLPTVNLGLDSLFCDGRLNKLLDATVASNKATYLWQDGSKNPTLLASQDQKYWVIVNDRGCKAGDTVNYVFSSMPTPNLGPDIPTCIGVPAMTLDATSGSIPASTYLWQNGDQHPTFYAAQTGTYSVLVNSKGCIAGDTVFLFLGAFPIVDLGPDRVICPNEEIKLSVMQSNVEATWENGSSYLEHIVNQPGTYSVHVVTNTGCMKDGQVTLLASGLENVDLGEDKTICSGDSIMLAINVPFGATYTWSTGLHDVPIPVKEAGEYSINISTTDCHISDNIKVSYSDCQNCYVYVPSAFSPNGDNVNDAFFLKSNCTVSSNYSCAIYDRMGRKVWDSSSIDDEWKGDVKGVPVPEGVYTYHLRCNLKDDGREKHIEQGGTITVIR